MNRESKRIITLFISLCAGFILLIGYLSYFQIFKAETIRENQYNKRLWIDEEEVLRGSIIDRDEEVLVYSQEKNGSIERVYKYDYLYSHIIGYSTREYGKSGLEKNFNSYLINANRNTAINEVINLINPVGVGNNLKLTIDTDLQRKSRELLRGKKGAIIAMDPKTGEILSMVSLPDYNVNSLIDNWAQISEDTNSPLINRGVQGLYTPGSTFKIVTALSSLELKDEERVFNCQGSIEIDGYIFKDFNSSGHGSIGLLEAFSKSCNTYFASLATHIGYDELKAMAESLYFNQRIPFDLDTSISRFPETQVGLTDLAASGIGQGRIGASPLNMLLITSAIANDGDMMKPYIVEKVISPQSNDVEIFTGEILTSIDSSIDIVRMQEMMREVVINGTGTNARIRNVQVAGKTGTAENASGKNHAWFVGYAPYDDPKVAVVVLLEEDGSSGGGSAAPIARDMMIYALNNIKFRR